MRETAHYLAVGAVSLMHTIDPDIVLFGGGMIAAGQPFLEDIRADIRTMAFPVPAAKTPHRVSRSSAAKPDSSALPGVPRSRFIDRRRINTVADLTYFADFKNVSRPPGVAGGGAGVEQRSGCVVGGGSSNVSVATQRLKIVGLFGRGVLECFAGFGQATDPDRHAALDQQPFRQWSRVFECCRK